MSLPIIQKIRHVLHTHKAFLICGHEDLDGDCIGSELGLFHWLHRRGKTVAVVAGGPTIANYTFLPGYDQIQSRVPDGFSAEVTFCLDTGSAARILPGVRPQGLVINIDHHAGNTNFGAINWVDVDASAVGEMLFDLLSGADGPLDPETATCLYLAILTDSGCFRYSKTSARTFEAAAALVRAGANAHDIAEQYYENVHPNAVRMTGEVFSNLHFECDGRLVWGEISLDMYERLGGPECQPEQLASQMRGIRGVEVAVLFHQMGNGAGRASFRSRGRVDASVLAKELGGGGHRSAAGCRFSGDYAVHRERVLEAVRRHIHALEAR
ncbi:MAG: bifunctional oligoribonuclease/PAP phosphatase NrnA [Candidatus Sumerlaeia bacterium]|nr:bifunctional oligoribonuclease/PAP phosphatase NrnA [Candidatus Sumerlaeia bacterium]